jgi:hypothetical protein
MSPAKARPPLWTQEHHKSNTSRRDKSHRLCISLGIADAGLRTILYPLGVHTGLVWQKFMCSNQSTTPSDSIVYPIASNQDTRSLIRGRSLRSIIRTQSSPLLANLHLHLLCIYEYISPTIVKQLPLDVFISPDARVPSTSYLTRSPS